MMKPFNMYVRTLITGEHGKILLLKQNRMDKKPVWDLPRTPLTEEESFDESVTNNIQKEIGYFVYPGKIIGVSEYNDRNLSEVHVIMEGFILSGELILSKNYEDYGWVPLNRLSNYPLAPWLTKYITDTDEPFKDVLIEIENMEEKDKQKSELVEEHIFSMPKVNTNIFSSRNKKEKSSNVKTEPVVEEETVTGSSTKSSFSLLKDTLIRTFHPKQANVSQTQPKYNPNYDNYERVTEEESIPEEENVNAEEILRSSEDDIIPETAETLKESKDEIIIEHEPEDIKSIEEEEEEKTIRVEPDVRVIREDQTPPVRKVKETNEKISFDSNTGSWRNKLNRINRTKANDENKVIPRPKGRKK